MYYKIVLLKSIHVYKEFESFGEQSLISDLPKDYKFVVCGNSSAHFAVLSKKDYKIAIGKLQNMNL